MDHYVYQYVTLDGKMDDGEPDRVRTHEYRNKKIGEHVGIRTRV